MARRTTRGETPACGFTLVEILVVVVILGILVTMAQPRVLTAVTSAREAVLRQDLLVLRDAIDQFYADQTRYPSSLEELVEKRYVRRVPTDPMTRSDATWELVFFLEGEEGAAEGGIFDVRSGSEGTALDGSRYADW